MAYPWADQLSPDDRVSSDTGYSVGDYLPLFEEHEYVCDACRLRYYLYDPFAHGTAPHGPCKVILALHGAGNALSGKVAVNYAAAEHFASPQRQAALGGAYVLVPMANETRAADGHAEGTWATFEGEAHPEQYSARVQSLIPAMGPRFAARLGTQSVYTAPLLGLLEDFRRSHPQAGPVLLMGTSAGGYGAWSLLQAAPERFAGAILMGAAHLPPTTVVDDLIRREFPLLICHGMHDELVPFAFAVAPHLSRYEAARSITLHCPRLVRNADGSVASNAPGGVEMGQHCINNAVHNDLLFADGTPMCPALPQGVTGWIRRAIG